MRFVYRLATVWLATNLLCTDLWTGWRPLNVPATSPPPQWQMCWCMHEWTVVKLFYNQTRKHPTNNHSIFLLDVPHPWWRLDSLINLFLSVIFERKDSAGPAQVVDMLERLLEFKKYLPSGPVGNQMTQNLGTLKEDVMRLHVPIFFWRYKNSMILAGWMNVDHVSSNLEARLL